MSASLARLDDCPGCAAIRAHHSGDLPRAAAEWGALTLLACILSGWHTPQSAFRGLCLRHRNRLMDLVQELNAA